MNSFNYLSAFIKRSSQLLQLTRDEIVRSTPMGSKSASAVWNGQDIDLSYYLMVLKLLVKRTKDPRYKYTKRQLVEAFVEAIMQELEDL